MPRPSNREYYERKKAFEEGKYQTRRQMAEQRFNERKVELKKERTKQKIGHIATSSELFKIILAIIMIISIMNGVLTGKKYSIYRNEKGEIVREGEKPLSSKSIIEILSNSAWQIPLQPLFNKINANKEAIQKIQQNQEQSDILKQITTIALQIQSFGTQIVVILLMPINGMLTLISIIGGIIAV